MKIEIRKVTMKVPQYYDSIMFEADLYIDGERVGTARNDGNGGECEYDLITTEGKQLIERVEEYCIVQGDIEAAKPGVFLCRIDNSLQDVIATLAYDFYNNKLLEKETKRGIVFGQPGDYKNLKFKKPISTILRDPTGEIILKDIILQKVLSKMKKDDKLINDNLPDSIINLFPKNAVRKPNRAKNPGIQCRRRKP